MGATLAQITALLLSAAILLMGNGLQTTLLPLKAQFQPETFSTLDIGILGSSYFLGFAAGCVLGPYLVRRVGHIRAFTAMVAIASTAPLLHYLFLWPGLWWITRALSGFCLATLFMIIESWLNERATNENRGKVFSTYTIINLTVMTLGQLMINLYDPGTFPLFALASILVSLAAVPLSLTTAAVPAPIKTVKIRLGHLYKLSPVAVVGAVVIGAQQGSFWSLAAVFAERIDMTTLGITIFMSAAILGGAIGQWPLGRLSDRLDRRHVIIGLCIVAAAIGLTLRILQPHVGTGIYAFILLYGATSFPLYSVCAAHMNDYVAKGEFVEASSGMLLLYAGGAVVGPLIASQTMGQFGPYALFGFTAGAQICLALFALFRSKRRSAMPEEERKSFTEALNATQSVSGIASDAPEQSPEPAKSESAGKSQP